MRMRPASAPHISEYLVSLVSLAVLTATALSLAECAATPAPGTPGVVPAAIDNCGTRVMDHSVVAGPPRPLLMFDLIQVGGPT